MDTTNKSIAHPNVACNQVVAHFSPLIVLQQPYDDPSFFLIGQLRAVLVGASSKVDGIAFGAFVSLGPQKLRTAAAQRVTCGGDAIVTIREPIHATRIVIVENNDWRH